MGGRGRERPGNSPAGPEDPPMRICLRAPEESRGFYLTAAAGVGRLGDSAAAFPGAFSR